MTGRTSGEWRLLDARRVVDTVQYSADSPFTNSKNQQYRYIFRARVFRHVDGRLVTSSPCGGHYHRTYKGARKCGEAHVRRLNRELKKES